MAFIGGDPENQRIYEGSPEFPPLIKVRSKSNNGEDIEGSLVPNSEVLLKPRFWSKRALWYATYTGGIGRIPIHTALSCASPDPEKYA